jgi:DOPA 4,5-dioxygenase
MSGDYGRSRASSVQHPLTDDDVADHTKLAHWIGEPIALDLSVLDPPGINQGIPRFGASDFQASTGPSGPRT